MASQNLTRLAGATASPYTNKMVALLRYRRLPYAVTWGQPDQACDALGVDKPKLIFHLTFFFDGEEGLKAECDSTPIIRRLEEIGRVYAPAQPANARAVQADEKSWECEIDGASWTQQTFPYQAKCLQWTNERYRALTDAELARVDTLLQGTGVETMLSLA